MSHDAVTASQTDVDVLVVGAGPVGLLLAAEVALGGASVQVLERTRQPSETIKAGSINLASAEILARRGLIDAARAVSDRAVEPVAELFASADPDLDVEQAREVVRRRLPRAGHFAGIMLDADLVDPDDPDVAAHREALGATLVAQREVEALLAEHAERLGVPVRRGVEVVGLTETDDGSAVLVETDAGDIRARWVVGCDGGRSVVRHVAGFRFPGTDPEVTGHQGVLDLDDHDAALTPGWNWSEHGVYRYGPQPGTVLTVEFEGPPADRDRPVTPEEMQQSLRRTSGTDVTVTGLRGTATRWTDNARQADAYRRGRVLLAGDAAHVHSPFSGQGLNLGLGDATNLGWKLAATVAGWAPDGLLDTYDRERHPLGEWVLDWTRAQVALMRPEPKVGLLRGVVSDLMGTTEGMTRMVNLTSGITQRIELPGGAEHPLVGRLVPDITIAGGHSLRERFVTGRFVLLDRTPDSGLRAVAEPWGERVTVVVDAGAVDAGPPALLARPDGVVVWAVDHDDPHDRAALRDALSTWAGAAGGGRAGARVTAS